MSKWFYGGIILVIIASIFMYSKRHNLKQLENAYVMLMVGLIGIISEFTTFANVLLVFLSISLTIILLDQIAKRHICWWRANNSTTPHYVFYARDFFPVLLAVWLFRSFLFEAYQIPSGSMKPDLTIGDFILVNKYYYGIRMPISNKVALPIHRVMRGDVVVFHDPIALNRDLIKRVVGLPGDLINYSNKRLTINHIPLDYTEYNLSSVNNASNINNESWQYIEHLGQHFHPVITIAQLPSVMTELVQNFPYQDNCRYESNGSGFSCIVPPNHYFMMGDNRDDSLDSRYWGFVPENNILGKAIYVWLNIHDLSRIWTAID